MALYVDCAFLNDIMDVAQTVPPIVDQGEGEDQGGGKPGPYPVRLRSPLRSRVRAGLAPALVGAETYRRRC